MSLSGSMNVIFAYCCISLLSSREDLYDKNVILFIPARSSQANAATRLDFRKLPLVTFV